MEVKAHAKFLRLSPRKARLVVDLVRGKNALEAISELDLTPYKAGREVIKIINSALANAQHNFGISKNDLYIKEINANIGPTFKRYKPRARGSADEIKRRMTHITVVLASLEGVKAKPAEEKEEVLKKVSSKKEPQKALEPKVETVKKPQEEVKPEVFEEKIENKPKEKETEKPVLKEKESKSKADKKEVSSPKTATSQKKTVKRDIKKIKEEETQQKGKVKVQKESFFGGLRKIFRRKGF